MGKSFHKMAIMNILMRSIFMLFTSSFLFFSCWEDKATLPKEPSIKASDYETWEQIINDALFLTDEQRKQISIAVKFAQKFYPNNIFLREHYIDNEIKMQGDSNLKLSAELARAIKTKLVENQDHLVTYLNANLASLAEITISKEDRVLSPSRKDLLSALSDTSWAFFQDLDRYFYPKTTVMFGQEKMELPEGLSVLEKFRVLGSSLEKYVADAQGIKQDEFFPVGKVGKFWIAEILATMCQANLAKDLVILINDQEADNEWHTKYYVDKNDKSFHMQFKILDDKKLLSVWEVKEIYKDTMAYDIKPGPDKYVTLRTEMIFSLGDDASVDLKRFYDISHKWPWEQIRYNKNKTSPDNFNDRMDVEMKQKPEEQEQEK